MDFLKRISSVGLVIGICTFLIIGLFHPIVVKAEYYWGTKCWWIFLLLGIGGIIASLYTENIMIASLLGVFAFSSFWTIKEIFEQEERVKKAGFPRIQNELISSKDKGYKEFYPKVLHISIENATFPPLSKQGCIGLVAQLVRATDS